MKDKKTFLKKESLLVIIALEIIFIFGLGCEDARVTFREAGTQFDITEWHTVPGDGCLPIITDYQSYYSEYVSVDNSNAQFSRLVADADSFKRANPDADSSIVNMDDFSNDYVLQNLTVIWEGNNNYDLQVYLDGEVVLQENDCSSGLKLQLDPGYYEIKVWDKSEGSFRNVWINVVGSSELENHIIHNITYLEKIDPDLAEGVHTASYSFQIPSFSTGITVEGGLFVWIGDEEVRLDYGTAFQLIVDNGHSNFGKIYYWDGHMWENFTDQIEIDNETFYKITFWIDIPNDYASIVFEDETNYRTISGILSKTQKDESWSSETVGRLQAECISKDGIKHIINFKDYSWEHLEGSIFDY